MGYPRALTAMVVALVATIASLVLFFRTNPQTFSSPLDRVDLQMDAGQDGTDMLEAPDSAEPAPEAITISTVLDRTAPIESYLRDAGMSREEAHQWSSYFARITANRYLMRGHPLTIYKDAETGEMRGVKYDIDERTTVMQANLGAGVIKAAMEPIEYVIRPIKLTFAIKDSFRRAAAENGIPRPIVESLEDAFSNSHDLNRLAPGAGVKLIYQEQISRDGTYTLVGDLEAAQIQFGSRKLTAISFRDEQGRSHLYDERGHPLGPQFLRFPVNFKYISSGFTYHRYHPILHQYRPHVGVDLAAQYGEPVKAVADGKVESAGWQGELGNCIRIEHQRGMVSIYGHLSKISRDVKAGSYVRIGQLIGNVGSTGLSTGPHLHFAMEKAGAYVNPLTEKLGENHEVSPRMHALFDDMKERYQAALSKLPDVGSHFVSSGARKPAISKFADMYHVSLKRGAVRAPSARSERVSSISNSDGATSADAAASETESTL
ncbi:MAG TPA: M23 family metallopeptidase [Candidatus Acidoferrales bacterium]|nr:M23 family metallopeptidase [Candidatus Acidoferrales bacterium]